MEGAVVVVCLLCYWRSHFYWGRLARLVLGPVLSESDLYPAIIGELSHGRTRLFRQQSALAWAGRIVSRTATTITLEHPHAIKIGAHGMADLGGVTCVTVTGDMVGQLIGVDVQIEVKSGRGRPTIEQVAYLDTMQRLGARAGVARSVDEARSIILDLHPRGT
jgi:hypothetical protein